MITKKQKLRDEITRLLDAHSPIVSADVAKKVGCTTRYVTAILSEVRGERWLKRMAGER